MFINKRQLISAILGGLVLYLLVIPFVKKTLVDPSFRKPPPVLREAVENSLIGAKGTYGIVVKNLKTGESYLSNEKRLFEAGSLYKLWVALTAFGQIEKGELKEEEILSQDVRALNRKFEIASDSAEMKSGTISLSVKDAMAQMIAISHNYAALLLTEKVKVSKVADVLKKYKFNDSVVGQPPKTTALDIAQFLEKAYKEELMNKENTQIFFDLLKKQQLNDGLPKYLPKEVKVAHKTGDIGWYKHDAGIVYSDKGEYIIVIMSETDSPPGAQERIAQVSKAVYEYFNKVN